MLFLLYLPGPFPHKRQNATFVTLCDKKIRPDLSAMTKAGRGSYPSNKGRESSCAAVWAM